MRFAGTSLSAANLVAYQLKLYGPSAGMLGMGGGFIMAPLMLHLGIHPSVATATSNTVLFFSTSFAALAYERMDLLNYQANPHIPLQGGWWHPALQSQSGRSCHELCKLAMPASCIQLPDGM